MKTISDRIIEQNDIKKDLSAVLYENDVIVPGLFKEYPDSFDMLVSAHKNNTTLTVDIPTDNYEFTLYKVENDDTNYYRYYIDWGDGLVSRDTTLLSVKHVYEHSGQYVVKIPDKLSSFIVNFGTHVSGTQTWEERFISGAIDSASCIIDIRYSKKLADSFDYLPNCCFAKTGISSIEFMKQLSNIDMHSNESYRVFDSDKKISVGIDFSEYPALEKYINKKSSIGMFRNCVELPYVKSDNLSVCYDTMFMNCKKLSTALLPNLKSIGNCSFSNCNLTSLEVNECKSIGYRGLESNVNMSSLTCPKITYLGQQALQYCRKLQNLHFPYLKTIAYKGLEGCILLSSISISSIETLASESMYSCKSLISVDLNNVKTVSYQSFVGCDSLQQIRISEDNSRFYMLNASNEISNIGHVLIDSNAKSVLWGSMVCCDNVVLDDSISTIEKYAFYTSSAKSISGDGILSVLNSGMANSHLNHQLLSAYIKNVKLLQDSAFAYCRSLKMIDISNADVPPTLQSTFVFDNLYNDQVVSVYIKHGTTDAYMNASNWKAMVKSTSGRLVLIEKEI